MVKSKNQLTKRVQWDS